MLSELVVAGFLLITGVGILASGTVSAKRLWQDTQHHQLALDELSNQLERLSTLNAEERQAALESLSPSEILLRSLPGATLSASMIDDEEGPRISIQLQWPATERLPTMTLVGWVKK